MENATRDEPVHLMCLSHTCRTGLTFESGITRTSNETVLLQPTIAFLNCLCSGQTSCSKNVDLMQVLPPMLPLLLMCDIVESAHGSNRMLQQL